MEWDDDVIRVSAKSRPASVAGAIAKVVRSSQRVDVQAIGAGAVNQAVKGLAIAGTYLKEDRISISCMPHFTETEIDGNERTAIRFEVRVIQDGRG
jgi:stage V sporulation protein S